MFVLATSDLREAMIASCTFSLGLHHDVASPFLRATPAFGSTLRPLGPLINSTVLLRARCAFNIVAGLCLCKIFRACLASVLGKLQNLALSLLLSSITCPVARIPGCPLRNLAVDDDQAWLDFLQWHSTGVAFLYYLAFAVLLLTCRARRPLCPFSNSTLCGLCLTRICCAYSKFFQISRAGFTSVCCLTFDYSVTQHHATTAGFGTGAPLTPFVQDAW